MGTSYKIHCLDCDDSAWIENGRRWGLAALLKARSAIETLISVGLADERFDDLSLRSVNLGTDELDLLWFRNHVGHNLRVRSEYGEYEGDCNEPGPANEYKPCTHPEKHSGPHSWEPANLRGLAQRVSDT